MAFFISEFSSTNKFIPLTIIVLFCEYHHRHILMNQHAMTVSFIFTQHRLSFQMIELSLIFNILQSTLFFL